MNTPRLAEETYIDEGQNGQTNTQEQRTSLESAWHPVVADNHQSTKVSETAKYGQHAYSRLLMPHLCKLMIGGNTI